MNSRHSIRKAVTVSTLIKGMLVASYAAILNFTVITISTAATIPIINAGFEEPVLLPNTFTTALDAVPGWTIIPSAGPDQRAGAWYPIINHYPVGAVPDGNQIAYSNGPTLSQVVPWNLTANEIYRLTVEIGNRADQAFINGYEVQLFAGGTVLGFVDETMVLPDPGTFLTATVLFKVDPTNANIGQPLEIRLLSDGPQVSFDIVNL